MNRRPLILLAIALSALILLLLKEPSGTRIVPLSHGAAVLAFGDSLTYGSGVKKEYSYPSVLSRSSGLNIINAGIPGELSGEGLKRLGSLLKRHRPELVILCHGGNDILRRRSRDALRANLEQMVRLILDAGSQVLVVGVPDFYRLGFAAVDLYEEVADEKGVMYEGDVLSAVVTDSRLKSDRIHPNEKGYAMMAEAFLNVLRESGMVD